MCAIEWSAGRATVTLLQSRVADHDIVGLMATADKVGIDVPFGWPVAFAAAVSQHSRHGSWPDGYDHADNRALRFRRTDLWVRETLGLVPLSVSADRIALTGHEGRRLFVPGSRPWGTGRLRPGRRGLSCCCPQAVGLFVAEVQAGRECQST